MSVFQKLSDWLTNRNDSDGRTGSLGTYSKPTGMQMGESGDSSLNPADPFGNREGRVAYRSRYDLEQEEENRRLQQEEAARQQQAAMAQRAAAQQQAAMAQRAAAQQQIPQQVGNRQIPQGYPAMAAQGGSFPVQQPLVTGSHKEYVVLLRSRNECKDVIAYIKANASVFLNMEFIASDNERQRCVDMLSGAAYTLGCALNKISPRGIYLISSPSVEVVLDPALQRFSQAQESRRTQESGSPYARPRESAYSQQGSSSGYERPNPFSQSFSRSQQSSPFASSGRTMEPEKEERPDPFRQVMNQMAQSVE